MIDLHGDAVKEFRKAVLEAWAERYGYPVESAPPYVQRYADDVAEVFDRVRARDDREWFSEINRYGRKVWADYRTVEPAWYKVEASNADGGRFAYREWATVEDAVRHRARLRAGIAEEGPQEAARYTKWEILRFGTYVHSYVLDEEVGTDA
jgi:hypothetical protein